jgi:hypothetical protein
LELAIKDYGLAGAPLEEAESRAELTQLLARLPTRPARP